jgi:hypothetical protein
MKYLIIIALVFMSANLFAQTPCEYSTNVNDSIGTYKSTNEYMISEKNFSGNSSYIFYSLILTDGMPTLNVQFINKSTEFMKANCFDKNSKLFLQLNNGKIITLIHIDQEICGTLIRDDKGYDNRFLSGTFMFMKDSFEELKNSPVSMMRIKYLTATEDYILKKEFKSEMNNQIYNPEDYFINNLRCIE